MSPFLKTALRTTRPLCQQSRMIYKNRYIFHCSTAWKGNVWKENNRDLRLLGHKHLAHVTSQSSSKTQFDIFLTNANQRSQPGGTCSTPPASLLPYWSRKEHWFTAAVSKTSYYHHEKDVTNSRHMHILQAITEIKQHLKWNTVTRCAVTCLPRWDISQQRRSDRLLVSGGRQGRCWALGFSAMQRCCSCLLVCCWQHDGYEDTCPSGYSPGWGSKVDWQQTDMRNKYDREH